MSWPRCACSSLPLLSSFHSSPREQSHVNPALWLVPNPRAPASLLRRYNRWTSLSLSLSSSSSFHEPLDAWPHAHRWLFPTAGARDQVAPSRWPTVDPRGRRRRSEEEHGGWAGKESPKVGKKPQHRSVLLNLPIVIYLKRCYDAERVCSFVVYLKII